MKLFALFILHCMTSPLLAYRDGARENSCYDHSINHGTGTETFPCEPQSCSFFLRIREVVDDTTLELGNETTTYQCGQVYGSKRIHTEFYDAARDKMWHCAWSRSHASIVGQNLTFFIHLLIAMIFK